MSDNIKVAIKVRPLIKREEGDPIQWVVQENTIAQIDPETGKRAEIEYQFDHIYGMGQTNLDVFKETVEPIVEAAMKGFNGTIFAYGQTSSGKTYTMMGSKREPGVIPLAVDSIFKYIDRDPTRVYLLRVSYLEIYNEKINDLLNIEAKDLKIKEDVNGIVNVVCKEVMTHSPKEVLLAMRQGDKERRVGETNMNDRSSRSHTIFRITIESCVKGDADGEDGATNVSQLNLIDLAGSERARQTGATGERFNEGRHINLSLSTLSLVIKQLSESNYQHINFRDSKLTRILQASLGGNAMTTIICAVTPAALDETQCTLAFAQRAKGIRNKPQVNEVVSKDVLLRRVLKQVAKLNAQVGDLSCQLQEKDKEIIRGRIELLSGKMLSGSLKDNLNSQTRDRRRRTWGGNSAHATPPSATKFGYLPTIAECEQPKIKEADEEKKNYVKRRQSVMQQVDLSNSSFKTEFADFELQLIEDEKERMQRHSSDSSDGFFSNDLITRRVQFSEVDEFQECKNNYSPEITPEKKRMSDSSLSPGTPKASLREEIKALRSEVITLREFTTLEKQLFQDDCDAAENFAQHEKNLAFVKKSLEDSNQVCKDLNKKYSELQSEFAILNSKHEASVRDCENLTQQVTSLESFRDRFASMEAEKKEFKSKWIDADNKLKVLQGESSSHDYEIELMKGKHKSREKELEASLNSAWEDLKKLTGLDKDEIKDLGNKNAELAKLLSIVDGLNNQVLNLENQLQLASATSEENATLSSKVQELNDELEKSQEANDLLKKQVEELTKNQDDIEEFSKRASDLQALLTEKEELINENIKIAKLAEEDFLKHISDCEAIISENQVSIENSSKRILELEAIISEKEIQINKNMELAELAEADLTKKINDSEEIISESKLNAEKFSARITELEATLTDKEIQINKNMESLKLAEDEVAKRISDYDKIIDEKNLQLKTSEEVISTMKLDIEEMQLQLQQKCDELSDMKSRFEELTSLSEQEKSDVTSKAREELDSLRKSMGIKEDELAAALTQIEMKEAEISNQNEKIAEMKSQIIDSEFSETQNEELIAFKKNVELLNSQVAEKNGNVVRLEEMIEEKTVELCNTIKNFEDQMSQLQTENETLKTELAEMLEIMREKDEQLSSIPKIESQLKNISSEQEEHTQIVEALKQRLSEKEFELSQINSSNYQQEIEDLKNCIENLKSDVSSLKMENEELKSRVENLPEIDEMQNEMMQLRLMEQLDHFAEIAGKPVINKNIETLKLTSTANQSGTSIENDNECSSILANGSYFDSMDMSIRPGDSVFTNQTIDEDKTINDTITSVMENSTKNISVFTEVVLNHDLRKLNGKTPEELQLIVQELIGVKKTLEETLRSKSQEAEELQRDFQGFTAGMEKLKETVLLLTTENSELTAKANQDKKSIDEMKLRFDERIQKLLEEKKILESNIDEEKTQSIIEDYKEKMEILSKENIVLSANLMEKIEELDAIKEKLDAAIARSKDLEKENIDLSNNLMNKIEEYDGIIEKMRSVSENSPSENNSALQLLKNQISELKALNSKLSEAKLTSCAQCVELVEKNEVRMSLKNEVRILNKKLRDLQEKFEEENANAEILRSKVNLDFNTSILNETSMNMSILEGVDVSYVEEKIQTLQTELDNVKENHGKLEVRYQEKCNEIEKLRDSSALLDSSQDTSSHKREANICRIQGDLEKEKSDINYLKKKINSVSSTLNKLKSDQQHNETEIDSLKTENRVAEEKIAKASDRIKELEKELENTIDEKREFSEKNSSSEMELNSMKELLNGHKENNRVLMEELEIIKATPPPEREQVVSLNKLIEEYKLNVQKLEIEVKELATKLEISSKENSDLEEQIKKLESEKCNGKVADLNQTDNQMEVCESYESTPNKNSRNEMNKITGELETARESIKKEIALMNQTSDIENKKLEDKTVTELFRTFISVIMSKEEEIMKHMARNHEKERMKLVEKMRQSEDAEKRLNIWTKQLETDVERLQSELTAEEAKSSDILANISRLENLLKECEHEKQMMKEKMDVMETDFNILQTEYEKYSKKENTNTIQNLDKQIGLAIQNCQDEYRAKLSKLENSHKSKIEELSISLESLKTENIELKSNLDGLEASERQLKSIIDLKTNELTKSISNVERLEEELKNATDAFNQINEQHSVKSEKLEEITILLKQKCDKMSEYKTQLETISPEYDILREQAEERDRRLEKYKSEAEALREMNTAQITSLRDLTDQLEVEKLKSAGLTKQLADVTNRNSVVQSKLNILTEKCEELSAENARLVRKMRNSTDRETARLQLEDLTDQNQILQQDLERAAERINELQNAKSELLKVTSDLQGKYDSLNREKTELENTLSVYKGKIDERRLDVSIDEKFDNLVQEKNKITHELEEERSQRVKLEKQISNLEESNKDLNEEMDDLVKKILELQNENEVLDLKVYDLEDERSTCTCKKEDGKILDTDNLKKRLEDIQKDFEISCKTSELLRKENEELRLKLCKNNEDSREPKSTNSSRSASPNPLSSRRHRRSDLFNQNRPKELAEELLITEVTDNPTCQCESRLRKVQELEHQLALRSAKIKCLQMEIENDNQPYQRKCKEYEEIILSYKRRNEDLKAEIHMMSKRRTENPECRRCNDWNQNKRDQYTQCMPIKSPIAMTGKASGIIDDHVKITKLESEKNQLKQLCLSRLSQIKELRQQKETLEREMDRLRDGNCAPYNSLSKTTVSAAKENIPSEILGELKLTKPPRIWFNE